MTVGILDAGNDRKLPGAPAFRRRHQQRLSNLLTQPAKLIVAKHPADSLFKNFTVNNTFSSGAGCARVESVASCHRLWHVRFPYEPRAR